jgi:hypothetical protein
MIDHRDPPAPDIDDFAALAALAEQITRQLERGEIVDVNEYQRAFPYLAASIRGMVPTLHALVEVGRAINPVGANGHGQGGQC